MKPWLIDTDLTVYHADVLDGLRAMPDGSVDVVVTSPPYWGLRDYGVEGQLGLEPTIGEYLENMTAVFAEVHRVLSRHGTLWLNMGDAYTSGNRGRYDADDGDGRTRGRDHDRRPRSSRDKELVGAPWRLAFALQDAGWKLRADNIWAKPNPMPESVTDRPTKAHEYVFLFSKQRRYYFDREAVREPFSAKTRGNWSRSHHEESEKLGRAGSYRREYRHPDLDAPPQDESLYEADPLSEDPGPTDGGRQRAARAGDDRYLERDYGYHEDGRDGRFQGGSGGDVLPGFEPADDAPLYVKPDGWASGPGAHDAVSHSTRERQPTLGPELPPEAERGADGRRQTRRVTGEATHENHQSANGRERWPNAEGRNMRTVWTIALEGYPGAHFATFPRELARRCILAGCPGEVCRTCSEPRRRIVEKATGATLGWTDCGHADYRPGIVLDPFGGSGTTGEVARAHGRHAVLIELDPESCELIRERTQQLSLLGGET